MVCILHLIYLKIKNNAISLEEFNVYQSFSITIFPNGVIIHSYTWVLKRCLDFYFIHHVFNIPYKYSDNYKMVGVFKVWIF